MVNILFLTALALASAVLLLWSFRALPGEKWQIMACVPVAKDATDQWQGINLTYYGLLTANAYVFATSLLLILLGALGVPVWSTAAIVGALMLVCVPASRLIARAVEKKSYTFTVSGASFLGILLAPWIIVLINEMAAPPHVPPIQVLPALAALSISYAFGEGLGRLACISFGCCYGKPVSSCHPILRHVFGYWSFTFLGETKKIAYASNLDGQRVVPIQGVTAMLFVLTALAATLLFLNSLFTQAFVLCVLITQAWRVLSETLRADYRGAGKISAYQVLSIIAVVYALTLPLMFTSAHGSVPDLKTGLMSIWNPSLLVLLQAFWVVIFLHTGRSMVTGSTLSLHVIKERI